jgi:hypothetical protein
MHFCGAAGPAIPACPRECRAAASGRRRVSALVRLGLGRRLSRGLSGRTVCTRKRQTSEITRKGWAAEPNWRLLKGSRRGCIVSSGNRRTNPADTITFVLPISNRILEKPTLSRLPEARRFMQDIRWPPRASLPAAPARDSRRCRNALPQCGMFCPRAPRRGKLAGTEQSPER